MLDLHKIYIISAFFHRSKTTLKHICLRAKTEAKTIDSRMITLVVKLPVKNNITNILDSKDSIPVVDCFVGTFAGKFR